MKDPLFAASFTAANPGTAAQLAAAMAGEDLSKVGNMDDLLDNKLDDIKKNPEVMAAAFMNLINEIDHAAFHTCINDKITTFEAENQSPIVSVNLKTDIMTNPSLDADPIARSTAAATMAQRPDLVNECISAELDKLPPEVLKAALAAVLACDPTLLGAVANQEALAALGLSPEEMKAALGNTLDNEDARKVITDIMSAEGMLNDAESGPIVEAIGADDENKTNTCVMAVMSPINDGSEPPKTADIQAMLACDPAPKIPDTIKDALLSKLDTMTDEEIALLLERAMNDPDFAAAFNELNPELAARLAEAQAAAAAGTSAADLLAKMELTDEQMKEILENSCANPDFAKAMVNMAQDILADPAALAAVIDAMKTAVTESGEPHLIELFARLEEEFGADPKKLLEKIQDNPELAAVLGGLISDKGIEAINALDHDQLKDLFDQASNDTALSNLMVNGNAELASQLANINDANALFSSTTGEKIDPDAPCTKEIIEQIATLDSMSADEFNFHTKPELVQSGAAVEDKTNPNSPVT